jgi:hypothetical protein
LKTIILLVMAKDTTKSILWNSGINTRTALRLRSLMSGSTPRHGFTVQVPAAPAEDGQIIVVRPLLTHFECRFLSCGKTLCSGLMIYLRLRQGMYIMLLEDHPLIIFYRIGRSWLLVDGTNN